MLNKKTIPAIIVATMAAGKTSSPYLYNVGIAQQLCEPTCVDEKPVFTPVFSVADISSAGLTNMYNVTVHVEGVVNYTPCYCSTCCTRPQIISQDFVIPIYSTTAVSNVTLSSGTPSNGVVKHSCCNCSKTFVCDVALSLTVVTA